MKLKKIFSFIPFLFIIILFGCSFGSSKPDVYAKSEVKGNVVLQNLVLNIDSSSKTAKVKCGEFESESSKLSFYRSTTVFIRETKNEIGIKSKYENVYYYYEIKLSDSDKEEVTKLVKDIINEAVKDKTEFNQDAKNLEGFTVTGIGLYIERHLCNGKLRSDTSDFYVASAILENGSYYYGGDSNYKMLNP